MTLEQAIDRYTNNAEYERIHGSLQGCMEFRQLAEWLKDYKRLLEQQPVTTTNNDEPITVIYPTIVCDDAINRILKRMWNCRGKHTTSIDKVAMEQIIRDELPPVTPKQKYGKWIVIDDCEQFIAKCSECGRLYDSRLISKYPYCHCGAKMFDPQESEEV